MKKLLVMLCVAGLLTGCAVSGEKKTDQKDQKPAAEEQKEPVAEEKTNETEEKDGKEADSKDYREYFRIEADGIDYLSVDDIQIPEGSAIVMIGKDSGSGFWKRVKAGAEQAVTDLNSALGYTGDAKVKLTYDAPSGEDVSEQIDIIDQMLDKNPDAMIIGFVDVNSGKTQLELAEANGVPVLTVDSSIENSLLISNVQTDNYAAGAEAARKICGEIGDAGQIALLVHSSETETGIERVKGFTEEIEANHPDVEIVSTVYRNQDERSVADIVAAVRAEYPELKAYFGTNDTVMKDLLSALSVNGSEEDTLVVAGFDASARQIDAVKNGKEAGVMAQDPFGMGYAAAVSAFRSVAELDNAQTIHTGYYWITSGDLEDPETDMLTYK